MDLVIRNARILDGTGAALREGDVAVVGGRINAVGAVGDVDAATTIDAAGAVLSPGFVDVHTHDDGALLRHQLEAAIAQLPPRLRAVVVLRDIYDLSHAEIADELGISESAAKVRLHRARRRLRTQVFPLAGEAGRLDPEEHAHAV